MPVSSLLYLCHHHEKSHPGTAVVLSLAGRVNPGKADRRPGRSEGQVQPVTEGGAKAVTSYPDGAKRRRLSLAELG